MSVSNPFYYFSFLTACIMGSEFLKRLIYSFRSADESLYFLVVASPLVVTAAFLALRQFRFDRRIFLPVGAFFLFYTGLGVANSGSLLGPIIVVVGSFSYALPFTLKQSGNDEFRLPTFMLILVGLSVVYGLGQHLLEYFPWERAWGERSPSGMRLHALSNFGKFYRTFSLFSGLQDYSLFVLFVGSFAVASRENTRGLKLLVVLLSVCGLYMAAAKSILFALPVAAIAVLFVKVLPPGLFSLCLTVGPFAVLLWLHGHLAIVGEISAIAGPVFDPATIIPRLDILASFLQHFGQHVSVVGTGFGTAPQVYDNMYLRILGEYGLLGMGLFVIASRAFYQNVRRVENLRPNASTVKLSKANAFFFTTMMVSMHAAELLMSRFAFAVFCVSFLLQARLVKSAESKSIPSFLRGPIN